MSQLLTKKGKIDNRSIKSKDNANKAREALIEYIKKGKEKSSELTKDEEDAVDEVIGEESEFELDEKEEKKIIQEVVKVEEKPKIPEPTRTETTETKKQKKKKEESESDTESSDSSASDSELELKQKKVGKSKRNMKKKIQKLTKTVDKMKYMFEFQNQYQKQQQTPLQITPAKVVNPKSFDTLKNMRLSLFSN
jgi:hypothetical protein